MGASQSEKPRKSLEFELVDGRKTDWSERNAMQELRFQMYRVTTYRTYGRTYNLNIFQLLSV